MTQLEVYQAMRKMHGRSAIVFRGGRRVYTVEGMVINDRGIVDRWRDCVSEGSVKRKVEAIVGAT